MYLANSICSTGAASRFVEPDFDAYLSQQPRYTPPRRRPKPEQDLGAKMVAARISVAMTGKPPAPSIKDQMSAINSDSSSSSSSSGKVSSSSSLIAQGLLAERMVQGQVTPRTSPTKDEGLHVRPDKGPAKNRDVLETIREMAAQNGGLPDDAIDDESSYASSPHLPRHQRAFSFDAGNDGDDPDVPPSTAEPSLRQERKTEQERPPSFQLDGLVRDSGNVAADSALNGRPSGSSGGLGLSSDGKSNQKWPSSHRAVGHKRGTDAVEVKATTTRGGNPDERSGSVQLTEVLAHQRDAIASLLRVSPTKKVQERQVPRISQFSADGSQEHRMMSLDHIPGQAQISDEELALVGLIGSTCGPYLGGYTESNAGQRLPSQDAAAAATKALKRSTPGQKSPHDLQV